MFFKCTQIETWNCRTWKWELWLFQEIENASVHRLLRFPWLNFLIRLSIENSISRNIHHTTFQHVPRWYFNVVFEEKCKNIPLIKPSSMCFVPNIVLKFMLGLIHIEYEYRELKKFCWLRQCVLTFKLMLQCILPYNLWTKKMRWVDSDYKWATSIAKCNVNWWE